jgi:vinculin
VQDACSSLQSATEILLHEPASAFAKKQLIEGERGILQGVSAILLTFDESEVRKIVKICNKVIEYLEITEALKSFEDLIAYIKVPNATNLHF